MSTTLPGTTCQDHPQIFAGIRQLKNFALILHINQAIVPVAQPARRLPFHLCKQVTQDLNQLEQAGIIEDVKGPTLWIPPLFVLAHKMVELFVSVSTCSM